MGHHEIFAGYGIDEDEINREVEEALRGMSREELEGLLDESVKEYNVNTVLEGRIVNVTDDDVMIDIGYKSEGVVPKHEWDDPAEIEVGGSVEVLLEAIEDDSGLVQLSKQKADRIRSWERVTARHQEGDIVTGRVLRKIKGGLLVEIGVPVFLPASQVDIRRPGEIANYIGMMLTCRILKIDEERRNIVVSRRQLIESQRETIKARLFNRLAKGQIAPGKVKNIVDFGAFVDLGGIDGLLHITDMSWGRITHPSEMVAIDDEIEVRILGVDSEKGKVALGLKQKTPSPWELIEEKYPIGSTVRGEVVNLVSYGAFVKLEEGVEGLVHISEMSWTRRVNHPREVVAIGDAVDVVILGINKDREEISLGMKQTEQNPWELVEENYPAGTKVVGQVRNLTSYGAFIEIEEGIDGLLHVSDMSWTKRVNHPSEILKKGDTIEAVVLEVDPQRRRVALGLKQLEKDPWEEDIPGRYMSGDLVRGVVSKLTSFGAFVELEDGLEGLLHISELSDKKIASPEEIVNVGDVVDVRVIRVDPTARKIGLSLRQDVPAEVEQDRPRIVIRTEELEVAESPQQMIEEALKQAPQRHPGMSGEQRREQSGPAVTLNLPARPEGGSAPEQEEQGLTEEKPPAVQEGEPQPLAESPEPPAQPEGGSAPEQEEQGLTEEKLPAVQEGEPQPLAESPEPGEMEP